MLSYVRPIGRGITQGIAVIVGIEEGLADESHLPLPLTSSLPLEGCDFPFVSQLVVTSSGHKHVSTKLNVDG